MDFKLGSVRLAAALFTLVGVWQGATAAPEDAIGVGDDTRGVFYVVDTKAYDVDLSWTNPPVPTIEGQWRNCNFTFWATNYTEKDKTDESGNPVLDDEGNPVKEGVWTDQTKGGWSMRRALEFSGYAISIDGKDYPVYKGAVEGVRNEQTGEYVPWNNFTIYYEETGGAHNTQMSATFKDGNLYRFYGDDRGVMQENYDPATDPNSHYLTDADLASHNGKRYTIYFNGNGVYSDYQVTKPNPYNPGYPYYTYPDTKSEIDWDPLCRKTHVHLWGPAGDLATWDTGKPLTRRHRITVQEIDYEALNRGEGDWNNPPKKDVLKDADVYTGNTYGPDYNPQKDYRPVYDFEFVYFGGNPTGVIFRQEESKGEHCDGCDHTNYFEYENPDFSWDNVYSHHSHRVDFQEFVDGGLYQYSVVGPVQIIRPDHVEFRAADAGSGGYEAPDPRVKKKEDMVKHTIYLLDVDNWMKITDGDTPDDYDYPLHRRDYPEGNDTYYDLTFHKMPTYHGLHGEIPHTGDTGGSYIYHPYSATPYYDWDKYKYVDNYGYGSWELEDPQDWDDIYVNVRAADLLLATEYVSGAYPWGIPADNIRIDYTTSVDGDDLTDHGYTQLQVDDYSFIESLRRTGGVEYAKYEGRWYPIFKIDFELHKDVTRIEINRKGTPRSTLRFEIKEGGVYMFTGREMVNEPLDYASLERTIVHSLDEIPANDDAGQGRDIYVNLGANQILYPNEWRIPYAVPYKRVGGQNPHDHPKAMYTLYTIDPVTGKLVLNNTIDLSTNFYVDMPKWVRYDAEGYRGSELQRCEMTLVEGHPGVYKFHVDDVSKYNDFMCFYYRFSNEIKLREVSEEEFMQFVEDHGLTFSKNRNDNDSFETYNTENFYDAETNDWYINAYKGWTNPDPEYAELGYYAEALQRPQTDKWHFVKGISKEPITEEEYYMYGVSRINGFGYPEPRVYTFGDEYVYVREVHACSHKWTGSYDYPHNSIPQPCCEMAYAEEGVQCDRHGEGSPMNEQTAENFSHEFYYYYKVKVDWDSHPAEEIKNQDVNITSEGYKPCITAPEEYPYDDMWVRARFRHRASDWVYYIFDHIGEREEPDDGSHTNGETSHLSFPASRSRYHDARYWDKYVYDIGSDCLHQSYMTPEEFLALPQMPDPTIPTLYFAGNEVIAGNNNWDLRENVAVNNEMGCFFYDFKNMQPNHPAEFKISTVDVKKYADRAEEENFDGYYNFQRGWATFNLGLVGPHFDLDAPGYQDWYDKHVEDGAPTRKVNINTDETYDYNHYTQYPWQVKVGVGEDWHGMKPGNYYFVVDLLPEDNSVSLLDFDPHPRPYFSDVKVRRASFNDAQSLQLHSTDGSVDPSKCLPGSAHSGNAMHREANILSTRVDIGYTSAQTIEDEGYKVLYKIYVNDLLADYTVRADTVGKPEAVILDYLDLQDSTRIAVRARYYDVKTGRYFASKLRYEDADVLIGNLTAPEAGAIEGAAAMGHYFDDPKAPSTMAVDAALALTYKAPTHIFGEGDDAVELINYPGYEVCSATFGKGEDAIPGNLSSTPFIHNGHRVFDNISEGWNYCLDWTPDDGSWPSLVTSAGMMPIVIENIQGPVDVKDIPASVCGSAKVNAIAVYPFLARNLKDFPVIIPEGYEPRTGEPGFPTAAGGNLSAPRRADQSAPSMPRANEVPPAALPTDLSEYKISAATAVTPVEVIFPEKTILSGVVNLDADPAEPSMLPAPVYYNLQGIRVAATSLTPGIYIEVRGSQTCKILVK